MSKAMWLAGEEAKRRWPEALLLAALGAGAMVAAWQLNWPDIGREASVVLGVVWLLAAGRIWRGTGSGTWRMAWWAGRPVRAWEPVAARIAVSAGLVVLAGAGWMAITRVNLNRTAQIREAAIRNEENIPHNGGAGATASPAPGAAGTGTVGTASSSMMMAGAQSPPTAVVSPANGVAGQAVGTPGAQAADSAAGTAPVTSNTAKKRHHRRHRRR